MSQVFSVAPDFAVTLQRGLQHSEILKNYFASLSLAWLKIIYTLGTEGKASSHL